MLFKKIIAALTAKERLALTAALAVLAASSFSFSVLTVRDRSAFVPVRGGTYTEAVIGQPVSLNPVTPRSQVDRDIASLLYSPLGKIMSGYHESPDRRVYSVKLQEELFWSDGEPLTTDDVIFTVSAIQNPETQSPLAKSWTGVVTERISALQVDFALPAPYAFFPETIARLPVIPEHIFEKIPPANIRLSAYNLEPVGNGPYRVKSFTKRKDGFITAYHLVPNEWYHGEPPFIRDFYFRFYENKNEVLEAFRKREVTGFGTDVPLPDDAYRNLNLTIDLVPMPRYYAVFLNQNLKPILKNKSFREFLQDATNGNALLKTFPGGTAGTAIKSPLLIPAYNARDEITEESEEKQQNIPLPSRLAEIKKKEKIETIELNLLLPHVKFLEQVAEGIRAAWQSAGIDAVNLIVLDSEGVFDNVIRARNYEMVLFGNVLENPADLFPFWHSSQKFFPGLNLSLYQNEKADTLMEAIRESANPDERESDLRELESIILKDAPAVFLFTLPYQYAHIADLKGTGFTAFSSPSDRFKDVERWYLTDVRVIP